MPVQQAIQKNSFLVKPQLMTASAAKIYAARRVIALVPCAQLAGAPTET